VGPNSVRPGPALLGPTTARSGLRRHVVASISDRRSAVGDRRYNPWAVRRGRATTELSFRSRWVAMRTTSTCRLPRRPNTDRMDPLPARRSVPAVDTPLWRIAEERIHPDKKRRDPAARDATRDV
jgi:hypothetical protein